MKTGSIVKETHASLFAAGLASRPEQVTIRVVAFQVRLLILFLKITHRPLSEQVYLRLLALSLSASQHFADQQQTVQDCVYLLGTIAFTLDMMEPEFTMAIFLTVMLLTRPVMIDSLTRIAGIHSLVIPSVNAVSTGENIQRAEHRFACLACPVCSGSSTICKLMSRSIASFMR